MNTTKKTSSGETLYKVFIYVVLAMLAIAVRSLWLLLPAFVLWVVMLAILFAYWRCPHCGKGLPKTGKISACPRCGEEIH